MNGQSASPVSMATVAYGRPLVCCMVQYSFVDFAKSQNTQTQKTGCIQQVCIIIHSVLYIIQVALIPLKPHVFLYFVYHSSLVGNSFCRRFSAIQ